MLITSRKTGIQCEREQIDYLEDYWYTEFLNEYTFWPSSTVNNLSLQQRNN